MSELPHLRCAHLPSVGFTLRTFLADLHYLATRNTTIMDWLEMQLGDSRTSFPSHKTKGTETNEARVAWLGVSWTLCGRAVFFDDGVWGLGGDQGFI
jgi:hypothetical protein